MANNNPMSSLFDFLMGNPVTKAVGNVANGIGQAATDIGNQLFTQAPNQQSGSLYNTQYQPKSPIVKSIENTVGQGASALDQYLSGQHLAGQQNLPTYGNVAGILNAAASGQQTGAPNKSVLATAGLLPMLMTGMDTEEPIEPGDTAESETTDTSVPSLTKAQTDRVTKQNPNGDNPIQNIDLSKRYGINAPARERQVQQTLNTEVPGNTATEVAANLQSTMNKFGKQIDNITGNNPSTASKEDPNGVTYQSMADDMMQKAQDEGLLKNPAMKSSVQKSIAQQINYIAGKGINPGGVMPAPIFEDDLTPVKIPVSETAVEPENITQTGKPAAGTTQYRRAGGAPAGVQGPKGPFREMPVKNISTETVNPDEPYLPNSPLNENAQKFSGGVLAQKSLDLDTLRKEYLQANNDNSKVLKNIGNGQTPTLEQRAQLLYRDTLKDKIGNISPEVSNLISKQHDLYDAADSVYDARTQEWKNAANSAGQNTGGKYGIIGKLLGSKAVNAAELAFAMDQLSNISQNPLLQGGVNSAMYQGSNFLNYLQGNKQGNSNLTPYSLPDPFKKYNFLHGQDQQNNLNLHQNNANNLAKQGNYIAAQKEQNTHDNLASQYAQQNKILDTWVNPQNGIQKITATANSAYTDIANADPGFWNTINQGYNALQNSNNSNYTKAYGELEALSGMTNIPLPKNPTKSAMQNWINGVVAISNAAADRQYNNWKSTQLPSGQTGIPSGPAGNNGGGNIQTQASPQNYPGKFNFNANPGQAQGANAPVDPFTAYLQQMQNSTNMQNSLRSSAASGQ